MSTWHQSTFPTSWIVGAKWEWYHGWNNTKSFSQPLTALILVYTLFFITPIPNIASLCPPVPTSEASCFYDGQWRSSAFSDRETVWCCYSIKPFIVSFNWTRFTVKIAAGIRKYQKDHLALRKEDWTIQSWMLSL